MAIHRICAVLVGITGGAVAAADPVRLHESVTAGQVTRSVVELKAEGLYRPGPTGDAEARDAKPPKPLKLRVATRLAFVERVLAARPDGAPAKVARKVEQAASAINGEVRPSASQVRPEVSLMVAERRDGAILSFSPGGPLTRAELELVEAAGDPLVLHDLLPVGAVKVGDRWAVGPDAARSLSGYDALAANGLLAALESLDDASAKVRLRGEARGAALGGEGKIAIDGHLTFDRKAGRIARLEVTRQEDRKPGPVEAGLDMKSTLTVVREAAEAPAELSDEALAALPTEGKPEQLLLLFAPISGRFTLLHDRDWHLFWDDARQAVLKRLDRGEVAAQCNLSMGPDAGPGRHQDTSQFRSDIRRALGKRFGQFLGGGELGEAGDGGYRYKVAVQGGEGDVPILWYYYLVASPDGHQLLATFTLAAAQAKRFGVQDEQVIGSLMWKGTPPDLGR